MTATRNRRQGQGLDRVEAYGFFSFPFFSFLLLCDPRIGFAGGWVPGHQLPATSSAATRRGERVESDL